MNRQINFKLWNNLCGLFVFLASATLYLITLEPTGSLWDCGEFASSAYKLEVCHAPGNPLFLLIGRLASMLASDPSHVALMINASSGIASALTIMFLFWTITWFARKILINKYLESNIQKILILGSGMVGALAYAVSDSFWFSAVEAEVYALSSLCTAVVFWCILKWEESPEETSDRWLLLIAYLLGLSIGVHLLNLLAIPSIILVYYFKRGQVNLKNTLLALLLSAAILLLVLCIVIPGIPKFISIFELIAVNTFKMPFNTGYLIGGIFMISLLALGFCISRKKKLVWVYNSLLLLSLILTGYSTYGIIIIRAHDNPPINMNHPEDPFALKYYLDREQYGKRALIYGPSFASPITGYKDRSSYERLNDQYIAMPLNPDYEYDKNTLMLFPRMGSNEPEHAEAYKSWSNFVGKPYHFVAEDGSQKQLQLPTFADNMAFLFNYQIGYMYLRYFMWNFAGRQSDVQGRGNVQYGNWLSGIPFIDKMRLGPQNKITSAMKNNRGRNVYYMLPLLLGIIGLYFHFKTDKRNFSVLALLFFFTGIAIILYLNEIPATPRERDYVHVGSFYVFAIWIGLGCLAFGKWANEFQVKGAEIKPKWKNALVISAIILSLSAPCIMLAQNFDDHNRSNRTWTIEYARNYLNSCEPNAILFTNADNDTYPLWYAQEVEGVRRDVRIILLPYLATDWYVNQMRQGIYNQEGIKFKLNQDKIAGGKRTYLPVIDRVDSAIELSSMLNFVASEDSRAKVKLSNSELVNFIPSHQLFLKTDKQQSEAGISAQSSDSIYIKLGGNYLTLDKMMLLDIISSNLNKRPIYFASVQVPMEIGLDKYLKMDGIAYKLTSYKTDPKDYSEIGFINSAQLYQQYMEQFEWSSLPNPHTYLDNFQIYTTASIGLRTKFSRLAAKLIEEGQNEKAIRVLDKISETLPNERVTFDYNNLNIASLYIRAGNKAKGMAMLQKLKQITHENDVYFNSLSFSQRKSFDYDMRLNAYLSNEIENGELK
jgi:hypothetical protein